MEDFLNKLFDKHAEGYGVYDREQIIKEFTEKYPSLQLLQSCVSSGSLLQTCRKCNSMIFNADGTKCIQCNENHY